MAEYARSHGEWYLQIEERELRGHLPDWISTWDGDGIICRISDPKLAGLLAAAPCPVVDLYGQIRHPDIRFLDTDTIASDDPIFVSAMRFIRSRAHEKIDAAIVVTRSGLSRSSMESRFRKNLGRSIKEEIVRTRIARAMILLRKTDLNLQEIADASGFATASHFSRLFKAAQNMTLGAYRECGASKFVARSRGS